MQSHANQGEVDKFAPSLGNCEALSVWADCAEPGHFNVQNAREVGEKDVNNNNLDPNQNAPV